RPPRLLYFPVNNRRKTRRPATTWRFVFPLSHRIKSGNTRRRRFFGRLALPPITGRNRTKTGKSHNPGFARPPARAIVNACRHVRMVPRALLSVMLRSRALSAFTRVFNAPWRGVSKHEGVSPPHPSRRAHERPDLRQR